MTTPERSDDCLFCKIVAGDIPAEIVHATETAVAFRDVNRQAPTHVLVVPTSHYENAGELARHEPATAAELLTVAAHIAEKEGIEEGYRLVFNTGSGAGQTVWHAHLHVLGGRPLTWPPG
ncbi:histidine triad nucleotide-binding protein [Nocardioides gansuensis]|uniref:Histidine triad nucleotide-binding protein n=1 Tax=Nocardioides gansuensis TaxID=2138300 RepID=A0A2T8FCL8_9ACTN|nr:histidine triad nucleotide-binding protein [Nocardioides gansuensis]PVG83449.1 histidine triad nucleotide-binding protein [Nocardioides gansuensis]